MRVLIDYHDLNIDKTLGHLSNCLSTSFEAAECSQLSLEVFALQNQPLASFTNYLQGFHEAGMRDIQNDF